jgi:peptidoglycan/LPS O-acetylase OafA/YrhL
MAGVEFFFVLSGFLVTGILLDNRDVTARAYFTKFYARRIIRLYPLYYGTLLLVFGILPFFVTVDEAWRLLSSQQWRLWFNLTNFPLHMPHWDGSQICKLGHFWYLAAQEQFYFVWPLIVFICSRRSLLKVCISFMLLGNLARLSNVIYGDSSFWLFHWSTITKIDGLVLGAALAILIRQERCHDRLMKYAKWGIRILGPMFMLIMFMPRWLVNSFGDHGMIFTQPIRVFLFASLLILALTKDGGMSQRMNNPILRWFGKYSYGLYIIHGLLRPAHIRLLTPGMFVSMVKIPVIGLTLHLAAWFAISMLLAWASWHCYEKHFVKLKRYIKYT